MAGEPATRLADGEVKDWRAEVREPAGEKDQPGYARHRSDC